MVWAYLDSLLPVEKGFKPLGEGNKLHFPLWLGGVKRQKRIKPEGRGGNFWVQTISFPTIGRKPYALRRRDSDLPETETPLG